MIFGLILLSLLGTAAQEKQQADLVPSISTSALKILDKNGKTRILLSASDESPSILVSSKTGKMAYWLIAAADGSIEESFSDKTGEARVKTRVAENGTAMFLINDTRGEGRAMLYTESDNSVSAVLTNEKGDPAEVPFGTKLK